MSRGESIFKELTEHEFIKNIMDDNLPLMKAENDANMNETDPPELTELQKYQRITGGYVGQILSQIDRVEQASILINSYPYIKAWRNHYGQFEYFQYHMEAYYLGVAGLVDRMLLLINQLCRLGANDRDVRIKSVIKGLGRGRHKNLIGLIENIKASTERVKKIRNEVAHAQRFQEDRLFHIGLIEHSLRDQTIDDKKGHLKADLLFYIKFYRAGKRNQLRTSNDTLLPLIKELFVALNAAYNQEKTHQKEQS